MAFDLLVNQAAGNGVCDQFLFDGAARMIAAGWRVKGSANGTTFENEGQTTGSSGTGTGGGFHVLTSAADMSANNMFLRLATPSDSPSYREILMMRIGAGAGINKELLRIEMLTDSGGFSSGASATTPPTASGAIALGQSTPGSRTAPEHNVWFPAAAGAKGHWWVGDLDENYDFMFQVWRTSNEFWSSYGHFRLSTPNSIWPSEPDPYVYLSIPQITNGATGNEWDAFGGEISRIDGSDTTQQSLTAGGSNVDKGFFAQRNGAGYYRVGMCGYVGYGSSNVLQHFYNSDTNSADEATGTEIEQCMSPVVFQKYRNNDQFFKGMYTGGLLKVTPGSQGPTRVYNTNDDETKLFFRGGAWPWPNDTEFFV